MTRRGPDANAPIWIYGYSIDDVDHSGWLKIGDTKRSVELRIAEQLRTAAIRNFTIHITESAQCDDGSRFITDRQVRRALKNLGFWNPRGDWMQCAVSDVVAVIRELRDGELSNWAHAPCPRLF